MPFQYFKIDLAENLFYIGFFIIFLLSFFIILEKFVNEDEFNKKLLKLETIVIIFVFGLILSRELSNITMLIIFL
ncbi:hypothetical protein HMPREF0397_1793 [Fusobacterium nucleatum subsp. nucleatum ATCC 23726]|uniref:Uncharacterized protein n=1 Tax=Fusobacterium nucleatum subsp. nucleatum (strain ATCC 23726 / VPI 4351) TaxID=525283 RepID=D5RF08_FUSN2|nr:hypothetical protein C4N14_03395 [Fusobacterium nucleatum subsp. nucleatum ATCC 23726]EFG94627.1 hypothetical protein HMPREF0397_1793 [Fusobacterium nucleatum subsp. nucleatum ATCC 23726]